MLGSRFVRLAAGLFVLSAVGALLWPQVTGYVSKFAVINAPILTVRAPMNGVISTPTPGLATAVKRDQVLLEIQARFAGQSEIVRATALVTAKSEQAAALQDEPPVETVSSPAITMLSRIFSAKSEMFALPEAHGDTITPPGWLEGVIKASNEQQTPTRQLAS